MDLDVRLPIGLMFSLFGLLLAGFGLTSDPRDLRGHRSASMSTSLGSRAAGVRHVDAAGRASSEARARRQLSATTGS